MGVTDTVMQSYGRCCAKADFFDDFYQHFLASSPKVREKFVNTDMVGQKRLLRQGILNLVMYARGMPDTKLKALGQTHNRHGFDIGPELYDIWLHSLLSTIKKHDQHYSPEIADAWKDVLIKGINVIKAHY